MTCTTYDFGNGTAAIVCTRGQKRARCSVCKDGEATKLCDFALDGKKRGKTCDAKLCVRCAVALREDFDFCPTHKRFLDALQADPSYRASLDHPDNDALLAMFPLFPELDRPGSARVEEVMAQRWLDDLIYQDESTARWDAAMQKPFAPVVHVARDRRAEAARAQPIEEKVAHVRRAKQTRTHGCHWPGCERQCPPAMWGCKEHWFKLPKYLRDKIWREYRAGQEKTLTPSRAYLDVAHEVEAWIIEHEGRRG